MFVWYVSLIKEMVGVGTLGWWFVCQRHTYGEFYAYDLANPGRGNLSKVKSLNVRVSKIWKIGKDSQHKYSTNQIVPLYFNTNLGFLARIIMFRTENLTLTALVFPLLFTTASQLLMAWLSTSSPRGKWFSGPRFSLASSTFQATGLDFWQWVPRAEWARWLLSSCWESLRFSHHICASRWEKSTGWKIASPCSSRIVWITGLTFWSEARRKGKMVFQGFPGTLLGVSTVSAITLLGREPQVSKGQLRYMIAFITSWKYPETGATPC